MGSVSFVVDMTKYLILVVVVGRDLSLVVDMRGDLSVWWWI